jgi:hypothetical protein
MVVVALNESRVCGTACPVVTTPGTKAAHRKVKLGDCRVFDTVLDEPVKAVMLVEAAVSRFIFPQISQSPAVSDMLVTFLSVFVTKDTAEPCGTVEEITSPTAPTFASLFVVVPTIPKVWEGVIEPENVLFPAIVSLPVSPTAPRVDRAVAAVASSSRV